MNESCLNDGPKFSIWNAPFTSSADMLANSVTDDDPKANNIPHGGLDHILKDVITSMSEVAS